MSTNQEHNSNIGSFAKIASGIVTVDNTKQTCWFCSDRGHIITAGHIFFQKENNGLWKAKAKQGDLFHVEFKDQGIIAEAELIEKPCLDEEVHLDLAVMRLTGAIPDGLRFLPLCSHDDCLNEGAEFIFCGLRQSIGEDDLTCTFGRLMLKMKTSGVVERLQVTRNTESDVKGLSGAAACAICKKTSLISALGLQSQQAQKAEEELFVVPSARLIEASPTLQGLYDALFWTNREGRICLLRKLRDAIKEHENSWKQPDKCLASIFRDDPGPCVGPGVTCTNCRKCALAFLGDPNPKRLLELIEKHQNPFILLYGSMATGKTKSSISLYVASMRPPYTIDRDVRLVLVCVNDHDLLNHAKCNLQVRGETSKENYLYAFIDAFLIELLRTVMEKLHSKGGWYGSLSEDERRSWCKTKFVDRLIMSGVKEGTARGNLLLGLKAVLAGIVPPDFKMQNEDRLIIYLDNAHLIDEFIAGQLSDLGVGEMPYQPVNELLTLKRQRSAGMGIRNGLDQILQNRFFIITTRHVPEIISSTSLEAISSKVRALPIEEVVAINAHQISTCLESRSNKWNVSGIWHNVGDRIRILTEGHPWYVHNFIQFYDCILSNTNNLHPMVAADIVAMSRFLWIHKNPLDSREGCLAELEKEINCLENKVEYLPPHVDLHDLAKDLMEQSDKFSLEQIVPVYPHFAHAQKPIYSSPSPEDVGKILPAVRKGLVADFKEANEWRYANIIVATHFAVRSRGLESNWVDVAARKGSMS